MHATQGIVTEAWSPLAMGTVVSDATIIRLTDHHGVTPAQLVLRWHLQIGNVVIPKSVTPARSRENFDVVNVELSPDDLAAIATHGLYTGEGAEQGGDGAVLGVVAHQADSPAHSGQGAETATDFDAEVLS